LTAYQPVHSKACRRKTKRAENNESQVRRKKDNDKLDLDDLDKKEAKAKLDQDASVEKIQVAFMDNQFEAFYNETEGIQNCLERVKSEYSRMNPSQFISAIPILNDQGFDIWPIECDRFIRSNFSDLESEKLKEYIEEEAMLVDNIKKGAVKISNLKDIGIFESKRNVRSLTGGATYELRNFCNHVYIFIHAFYGSRKGKHFLCKHIIAIANRVLYVNKAQETNEFFDSLGFKCANGRESELLTSKLLISVDNENRERLMLHSCSDLIEKADMLSSTRYLEEA
jgi:archaellum component FlaC